MSEAFWVIFDIAFVLAFAVLAGLLYQRANKTEDSIKTQLNDIDKRVNKIEKSLYQSKSIKRAKRNGKYRR